MNLRSFSLHREYSYFRTNFVKMCARPFELDFKGPYSNLEFEGEIKFRRRLFKFSIKVMLDD